MYWKLKAKIQNAVSLLPPSASYAVYYMIQRHFGSLRRLNPTSRLIEGINTWKRIQRHGYPPSGKVFLEIGTGRVPLVPLAFWLMGAEKTISIDLNQYLKEELVVDCIRYIDENAETIFALFGTFVDKKRFNELLEFGKIPKPSLSEFLDLCKVDYIAPGDAADIPIADQSIDFHTSCTVFEHIPQNVLRKILEEGNRVIKDRGLFVHRIDYSDHFSHTDKRISAINFFQYNDDEWEKYAGNRYMYMNRLRHDDFITLFESIGHRIVEAKPDLDKRSFELLKNGNLHLNERFSSKSEEILAITASWMITQKKG